MTRPAFRTHRTARATRGLLGRMLLALLLVFMQQHATLHWLGHAIDATHARAGDALPTPPCDECAGLCAFHAAAPSAPVALPVLVLRPGPVASATGAWRPAPLRLGYRSRAPPVLA